MRYALALTFLIIATVVGVLAYRTWTSGLPVVLPPPATLDASASGGVPLQSGGWTNSASVDLQLRAPGTDAGADVEVRPLGQAFSDSPTASVTRNRQIACKGKACGSVGPIPVHLRLADGAYHWQARLHNDQGVSPWVASAQTIHIDTRAPAVTQLSSPSDPNPGTVYHTSTLRFSWQGSDVGSGVAGYSYRFDQDPHGTPRPEIRTTSTAVTLQGIDTGQWYFHVRGIDRVGNWGSTVTFPVRIDVTPPGLSKVSFSTFSFDPQYGSLQVAFAVTRAAREVHVGIYRQSDNYLTRLYKLTNLKPGQQVSITWDGKGQLGRYVTAGAYAVYIRAIDQYGHSSLHGWNDFYLDYKHIVVSLSQQKLVAYDGNTVFLTSLVTTGNPALPTPTGTFEIQARIHPFTFHSPWPKSSPYWYPPSKVQYAMLFREGGYFIHDAPWRSVFGPGSNQQVGTPGQNYTGTHGCINVPPDVAARLFGWVNIGTIVQVVK